MLYQAGLAGRRESVNGSINRHLPPALGRNFESYESRISFIVADKFAASC